MRQDRIRDEAETHAEQREDAEGGEQDDQMQPPVQQARDHHVARQAGAMQEEEERDGDGCRRAEIAGKRAACRQDRCKDDRADQKDRESVGQETAHGLSLGLFGIVAGF